MADSPSASDAPRPEAARTIRIVVEYDGTGLSGWQIQKERALQTVQGLVEHALAQVERAPVTIRSASRTDAGVHARGQVAIFRTRRPNIPPMGFAKGANRFLPPEVRIWQAEEVAASWDPRATSRGKRYRYLIWNHPIASPLWRRQSWHVSVPLSVERMHTAAQRFLGTHDFDAFRATGCQAKHARRTMYRAWVERVDGPLIAFFVEGNAFVRNMVRIMAGTLKEVGEGRRPEASITELLADGARPAGGVTAPPEGLCLQEVIYDDRLPPRPSP